MYSTDTLQRKPSIRWLLSFIFFVLLIYFFSFLSKCLEHKINNYSIKIENRVIQNSLSPQPGSCIDVKQAKNGPCSQDPWLYRSNVNNSEESTLRFNSHALSAECLNLENSIEILKNKISKIKVLELNDLLTEIIFCFDKVGIKLNTLKYQKTNVLKYYNKIDFTIEVNADYNNLVNFFELILNSKYSINCDKCIISNNSIQLNCFVNLSCIIFDSEFNDENIIMTRQSFDQQPIEVSTKLALDKQQSTSSYLYGQSGQLRDPFFIVGPTNIICNGIGVLISNNLLENKKYFALLTINNHEYRAVAGDNIGKYKITKVGPDSLILKDHFQVDQKIYLNKRPFNLK